jgi:uncharacterized protein YcbK (DUF882 family)
LINNDDREPPLSRRRLIRLGLFASTACLLPGPALASVWSRVDPRARKLSFYNLHTGENLTTVYWADGEYIAGALSEINYILRDFRRNEVKPIDARLLDLLHALRASLDTNAPFHVISGYRSPLTNAMLRRASEGVAAHSLHLKGQAIDLRVPGIELPAVRDAALALRGGGVGYYARSDFVHVDVGRIRTWA